MPALPAPSYPVTAITPGSTGGGGGGPATTHTYVTVGGIDGHSGYDGSAQALADRLELSNGTNFLFIQGNGSTTGSGLYRMVGGSAVAQADPINGSTVSVLNFYLDGSTESSGLIEARRVSGFWTIAQGYDFESPAIRKVTPRVLEVSGNSVVAEITRDSSGILSHNTLAILPYDPDAEGTVGNKIKLPAPANTGQRIVAYAADGTYGSYPGETVWWEAPTPASYSYLNVNGLFGLSYPITVTTDVTFTFTNPSDSLTVSLDGTFADFNEVITEVGTQAAPNLPVGWTAGQVPGTSGPDTIVAFYRTAPGAGQNISASATNGDPLGVGSFPVHDGADENPDIFFTHGVAGSGDGLLGAPGNEDGSLGGTHTSPGSLNAYRKGWVIVDGDGQWAVEKWPDRIGLNHGGWTSNVGPFGTQGDVTHMLAVVEYLKAWMNPAAGEDHLIRSNTSQVIGSLNDQHRWLVATTDAAADDVTYTLADANGDARKYTLSISRLPTDNGDFDFIVSDIAASPGGSFSLTLAPGEFCTVQSTLVGYIDGGLPSGTGDGELDHPDNQVFGWVRRG